MPQMCIDRIAPAIGGGDFGDGAIDLADAMLGGRDRNDRAIVRRPESLAPADIDIVRASVGRLDDQIVAVIRFVGETAPGHAPDQPAAMLRGRIIDALNGKRSERDTSELQSLMRRSYDVSFLKNKNIATV